MLTPAELKVQCLGERTHASPLNLSTVAGDEIADYVPDRARVLVHGELLEGESLDTSLCFEKAGPRETIFFDPPSTRAAIVTCGGLCPGLNNVIRSIVLELHHKYRVREVLGFRYGYQGLGPNALPALHLTPDVVRDIHKTGGSILGTSRGAESVETMVDTLEKLGVDILFTIGGDGTLKGSHAIHEEVERRGLKIALVGVPKTIDNDLSATDFTFGFDTALKVATEAVDRLHTTADAHDRVLIVETMGCYAGWIALRAGIAGGGDVILLPEIKYRPADVTAAIRERRRRGKNFSIVVVSEGAAPEGGGMTVMKTVEGSTDPVRLGGVSYRVAEMIEKGTGIESRVVVLGHLQRGGEPTPFDRWLATGFGAGAAELIAAGRFGRMVAVRGPEFVSVPLSAAVGKLKRVSPGSCEVRAALGVGTSFGRADLAARLLKRVCS